MSVPGLAPNFSYNSQNMLRPMAELTSVPGRPLLGNWTQDKSPEVKNTPQHQVGPSAEPIERPFLEAIPVFHSCPQEAQGSSAVKQLHR
jgi:hypothetical protein